VRDTQREIGPDDADTLAEIDMSAAQYAIVDHDGGIDDFPAFSLLVCSPTIQVKAITITPADSYREPALLATKRFVDYLGRKGIQIAAGTEAGIHPFPDEWRQMSFLMPNLPALEDVVPEPSNQILSVPPADLLVRLLSRGDRYTILATGPLTNLAQALRSTPEIRDNIDRLYFMGGAVRVHGNVEQHGYDGSAEWNVFNDALSASVVLSSGLAVTMVPLDVVNKTPLTRSFMDRLERQTDQRASRLLFQALNIAALHIDRHEYFFCDTLAAAALTAPETLRTERTKIKVITSGAQEGRTVETDDGAPVDVAFDADAAAVENIFLSADFLPRAAAE
jgi:purine nucleosidase